MAESKRFYWIKLKTDFFNQEAIDFLMSQENGCAYIVLYQMLCLKTANNNGEMSSQIGEMIVPYDVKKIVRDTKYFDHDTVVVALQLFQRLGLIYEQDNSSLRIANFEEMVGSESSSAQKVREWRKKKEEQNRLQCNHNVTQEIENRDRDKSIEIDRELETEKPSLPELYQKLCPRLKPYSEKQLKPDLTGIAKEIQMNGMDIEKVFKMANESDFLAGVDGGWQADFRWLMVVSNARKVLAGNYKNKEANRKRTFEDQRTYDFDALERAMMKKRDERLKGD